MNQLEEGLFLLDHLKKAGSACLSMVRANRVLRCHRPNIDHFREVDVAVPLLGDSAAVWGMGLKVWRRG